ncbi:MAG: hypothetical protein HPY81_04685 [Firmicutes bacterium]|nr:hypothetical protein [Bacillota bacterium]
MVGLEKALTYLALIVIAWLGGRLAARRIPPERRRGFGLMVILLVIIPLVILNANLEIFPRGTTRLALMLLSIGWIVGVSKV